MTEVKNFFMVWFSEKIDGLVLDGCGQHDEKTEQQQPDAKTVLFDKRGRSLALRFWGHFPKEVNQNG